MEIKKITKPKEATWLDGRGIHSTYHFDDDEFGRRVVARFMDKHDSTEIRAIEGDGCTDSFKLFENEEFPGNLLAQPDRLRELVLEIADISFGHSTPKP